jgi:hypothetical protein
MRTARALTLVVALVVLVALAAGSCWAGALWAGTAPGKAPLASKSYVGARHYPLATHLLGGPPDGSHPKPFNGTLPYSAWPDRAQVSGHKAAMSREIVVAGSKRRSATATRPATAPPSPGQ